MHKEMQVGPAGSAGKLRSHLLEMECALGHPACMRLDSWTRLAIVLFISPHLPSSCSARCTTAAWSKFACLQLPCSSLVLTCGQQASNCGFTAVTQRGASAGWQVAKSRRANSADLQVPGAERSVLNAVVNAGC